MKRLICIFVPIFLFCCMDDRKNINCKRLPNIIMVIGDDHGYEYFGFMGNTDVETPVLDKLARESMLFTNCHVTASVCPPSLRTLLTGLYPYQYDFILKKLRDKAKTEVQVKSANDAMVQDLFNIEYGVNAIKHFETLPKLLSQKGYVSFEGGKFWEGSYLNAGFTDGMTQNTDDIEIEQHGLINAIAGGDGLSLGRESNGPVFSFIDKYRDSTFFIWYAPMLPHTPHDPPEEFVDLYSDRGFTNATVKYYANITRFDARVGELLEFLDERGLRENTLILYVADNGYEQNPGDTFHPMGQRRGKGSMHEMGFRSPLIINWQGKIGNGIITEGFVSSVDLLPTILDFAGMNSPAELPGNSIMDQVFAQSRTIRDTIFGSMDQLRIGTDNPQTGNNPFANEEMSFYLTTDKWHFIFYKDKNMVALYDRDQDPLELNNLASEHPELVTRFKNQIKNWQYFVLDPFRDDS